MNYEELLMESDSLGLTVKEINLNYNDGRIKGNRIAIRKNIETSAEKNCVLAEELGHHYTSVGNILNMDKTNNRKLIDAFEHHCQNLFESAEYLNVTEEFLSDTINAYKNKYGNYVQCGDYTITFNPCLGVVKNF